MPTHKQFRYLVALAHTLHFRKAAEQCHVSQPTLSGQLKELEERLGVQLVERSQRSQVVLTPIGQTIAERARVVLRDVQDIVDLGRHGQQWLDGTIKLGALPTLGPYLLPHVLPELHQSHPSLKLYVREGMSVPLVRSLEDGDLDLLLLPMPMREADLESTRLFREQLWVVVPSDSPLAAKTQIERRDLSGRTVLALEPGHRLYEQVAELCREFGAELSHDFEGTSLDTIRLMVGMGMGISFMPTVYMLSEVVKDPQVVARPMTSRPPTRTVGLAWRRHSARAEEYRALADIIRGILRSNLPDVAVID
jgi:LysR family hydrogen peroxide-inducible transcriptional activator